MAAPASRNRERLRSRPSPLRFGWPILASRLLERLTKDLPPSGTSLAVSTGSACSAGSSSAAAAIAAFIFLGHSAPPTTCSLQIRSAPGPDDPQPPIPPPATKASRSTACTADARTLQRRPRVLQDQDGADSDENLRSEAVPQSTTSCGARLSRGRSSAELHLWRHQQDRVFGRIDDREQDNDLLASINHAAHARAHPVSRGRFFTDVLAIQSRQRSVFLLLREVCPDWHSGTSLRADVTETPALNLP